MNSRHSNRHCCGTYTVGNVLNNLVPAKGATGHTRRDVVREHSRQELVELVLSLHNVGNLNTTVVSKSAVHQV